jgi:hypothetical protein
MAESAPQYGLFSIIDKMKKARIGVFWLIFILSVVPSIISKLDIQFDFENLVDVINIILIILFFILDIVIEYFLVPQADGKRRDDFLDQSFGSKFSTNPSVGYFDTNELPFGLFKAASNLFENCFFTYNLIKYITVRKTIIPMIIAISIGVSAYFGFRQIPSFLSLLQVAFSITIFGELIKHFLLMTRLNTIQDCWIVLFSNSNFRNNPEEYKANIYRHWLQYETLHSRIQANITDKVFKKNNNRLTREWEQLKLRYNIN